MTYGFFRVAAIAPPVNVADVYSNCTAIIESAKELSAKGAHLIVTPELSITAYTCGDLFHSTTLLDSAIKGLEKIVEASNEIGAVLVVGVPICHSNSLYNCAVFIQKGRLLAVVPKTFIPNYNEFYEKRWFASSTMLMDGEEIEIGNLGKAPFGTDILINIEGVKVAAEICEDLWITIPPSCRAALAGAEIIVNLSASNDLVGKRKYLKDLIIQQSARCICGYVYAAAGFGESTTDLVFDGKTFIAENGVLLAESERLSIKNNTAIISDLDIELLRYDRLHRSEMAGLDSGNKKIGLYRTVSALCNNYTSEGPLLREISSHPFIPSDKENLHKTCEEILDIQALGLCRRLEFTNTKKVVIGISGGLDSTLAILVAVRAFDMLKIDKKGIVGITMPGFGTSGRTHGNALKLMEQLGISMREISIANSVRQHFQDIGHDEKTVDVTYENSQARERTQILMDVANQISGMVIGTGDLSELALGWATFNGDHISMYGVNAGVPKTLVKQIVSCYADACHNDSIKNCLIDIVNTPISPELIPGDKIEQKTEDLVGPYDLHDFFIFYTLRYGFSPRKIFFLAKKAFKEEFTEKDIAKWLRIYFRRFFSQQFKRSCLPDGPKVGSVGLSPRGDWRMPSDASAALWLEECDNLLSQ